MAISDTSLKGIKPADKIQRISIEHGLVLLVRPSGKKSWIVRYSLASGKRSDATIGEFPSMSLREAKKAALELQEKVSLERQNGSTATIKKQKIENQKEQEKERRKADLSNFSRIAEIFLNDKKYEWSESHLLTQKRRINQHFKSFFSKNINEFEILEIKEVFDKAVGHNKYVLAKKIYWILRDIFKKANVLELIKPEKIGIILRIEELGKSIPSKAPRHLHPRKWIHEEIGTLMKKILDTKDRWIIENSACLQIAPYVFVRASELVGMEWQEVDFEKAIWHIPAQRMKTQGKEEEENKRDHIVPLCSQVIEILKELYKVTGGGKYAFSGRKKGTHLDAESPNRAFRRMGYASPKHDDNGFVTHGFKSIASTELHQTLLYNSDMIEFQLAHRETNMTKIAYNHMESVSMLEKRAETMQAYANHLDSLRDKVSRN